MDAGDNENTRSAWLKGSSDLKTLKVFLSRVEVVKEITDSVGEGKLEPGINIS